MLGEVRESLERATELGMIPHTMEYPFAELLVGMGKSCILYGIDKSSQKKVVLMEVHSDCQNDKKRCKNGLKGGIFLK